MLSWTVTDNCPRWCARDHSADASGTAFYHASEASAVPIARPGDLAAPDRLEVQAAQYLPDGPGGLSSPPTVEIAVHVGGRYRLIGLSPTEARELAGTLLRAADAFGGSPADRDHRPVRRDRLR
jgi:hypothetical protein